MTMFPVTLKTAYQLCVDYMQAGITPFLSSSPGLGKSSLANQIARDFKLKLIDVRLSQRQSPDLLGLPHKTEIGRFTFLASEEFPGINDPIPHGYSGWLLFFDEFNSAPKNIQAAAYQPVLDHVIGNLQLHPNCLVMAAGNKASDKAIVVNQGTAMKSRLGHLEIEFCPKGFMEHMVSTGWDHRVIGFHQFKPDYGHSFNPDSDDHTFMCPRTWDFVNRFISGKKTEDITLPGVAGLIGDGGAVEFCTYIKEYMALPSYSAVVADPKGIPLPKESSTAFAMTSMLVEHYQRADFDKLADYVTRLDPEHQFGFYRNVKLKDKGLTTVQAFKNRIRDLTKFATDPDFELLAA